MPYTRREFGRLALSTLPAAKLLEHPFDAMAQTRKPNSVIAGVHIGTITYSYRSMPDQSAEATLRYIVESGIGEIELMGGPAESFAGAPQSARGGGGGGRGQPQTPEQQAAQREAAARLKQWRTSTDVAQLKRVGAFAEKRKIYAAYHTHQQGSMTAFDQAFAVSKGNMSNVDLGHYVAGTGESPIPFLRKFHDRIASVHLKDRQTPAHGAGNLRWGTGDTPLKEILQLMKKEQYRFPAAIEFEYTAPEGSNAVKEVAKCLDFCKRALWD